MPDANWNWGGLAYAERGLINAVKRFREAERFREAHDYYDVAVAITECLWWIAALDEWHKQRYIHANGMNYPRVKDGERQYYDARAETLDGRIVAALTWARNIAGHRLVETAEVGWHQLLLFDVAGHQTWHSSQLQEGVLVWQRRERLPPVRSKRGDKRPDYYDNYVAERPVIDILESAMSYLLTHEDESGERILASGVWAL